jgi:ribosome-binding protein aMBF1 (putative translation factor)
MDDVTKRIVECVGSGIRAAREAAGLSQAQLADLIEATQNEISLKERGKKDTKLETVLRIFAYCGAEVRITSPAGSWIVTKASEVYGVIRSAALKRGISNELLAVMSGVGKTTLADWSSKGIGQALISNVIRVCEALGQVMVVAGR